MELIRDYTNTVYRDGNEILKVYGAGWRTESEVRYELALLTYLKAQGLAVAAPIRETVERWETAEGVHFAARFALAPGAKPQPPFTPELYVAFGRAIGQFHALSSGFVCPHARRPRDTALLIEGPLTLVLPLCPPADRAFLEAVGEQLRTFLQQPLDFGPVHGDATLDNLHVTESGEIVLFDFDSGGPGWRAEDLQGWTRWSDAFTERGDAFRAGYASVRPLPELEINAAPYLQLAVELWGLQVELERRVLKQGHDATQAFLQTQLATLREHKARLL